MATPKKPADECGCVGGLFCRECDGGWEQVTFGEWADNSDDSDYKAMFWRKKKPEPERIPEGHVVVSRNLIVAALHEVTDLNVSLALRAVLDAYDQEAKGD